MPAGSGTLSPSRLSSLLAFGCVLDLCRAYPTPVPQSSIDGHTFFMISFTLGGTMTHRPRHRDMHRDRDEGTEGGDASRTCGAQMRKRCTDPTSCAPQICARAILVLRCASTTVIADSENS